MLRELFKLGMAYSRRDVGDLIGDQRVAISREGLFYAPGATLLFVTLDKSNKDEDKRYNDFFEGEFFHWDSQNNQSRRSPKILEITQGEVEVVLFARILDRLKGVTQPFIYCGQLIVAEVDNSTDNPVHILYEAIDFDPSAGGVLKEIYSWDPHSKSLAVQIGISAEGKESSRARRQRAQSDPKLRKAIELYAMKEAIRFYEERDYTVLDTSATKPYDLLCTQGTKERRVEVKGTQSLGEGVILTRNEIVSARNHYPGTDLFIVHSVKYEVQNEEYRIFGGKLRLIANWFPEDADLTPLQYTYTIPPAD